MTRVGPARPRPAFFASAKGRRAYARATLLCLMLGALSGRARADAYANGSADMLINARPEAGLLTLYSGYRNHPLVDAEAMVWMGHDISDSATGDVLTINVGLREPHGYGSARVGRLIVATGAIRPLHVDGIRLVGRAPFGTSLETFAGVPVEGPLPGGHDWLVGGRAAQRLWRDQLDIGLSYVHQRDAGMLSNEEVGGDLSLHPLPGLWLRALSSWDLGLGGLAMAKTEMMMSEHDVTARVYAERRVAARLLPATSLFSTISDSANSEIGTDGDYQWFPRLSVGGQAALQWIDDRSAKETGYRLTARSRLLLGDADEGDVVLRLSRRGGLGAGYNAVYLAVERALGEHLRAHAAGELVASDHPAVRGQVWPYLNMGLCYANEDGLTIAGGLVARATPEYAHEMTALVRIGYQESASP